MASPACRGKLGLLAIENLLNGEQPDVPRARRAPGIAPRGLGSRHVHACIRRHNLPIRCRATLSFLAENRRACPAGAKGTLHARPQAGGFGRKNIPPPPPPPGTGWRRKKVTPSPSPCPPKNHHLVTYARNVIWITHIPDSGRGPRPALSLLRQLRQLRCPHKLRWERCPTIHTAPESYEPGSG